jgi:hypothetical protein
MKCLSSAIRTAITAATLLSSLVPAGRIAAQADGTPIRIQTRTKPGKWITGRAAGITADSVGLAQSSGNVVTRSYDTLRYARTELARMEVSRGHKSNVGRGALIGGGIGLVLGVACVAATSEDDWGGCEGGSEVAVLTLGFGGLGALFGALSHHELWEEVAVDAPASGGGHRGTEPGYSAGS